MSKQPCVGGTGDEILVILIFIIRPAHGYSFFISALSAFRS